MIPDGRERAAQQAAGAGPLDFEGASNPPAARMARQGVRWRQHCGWRLSPGGGEHSRERGRQDGDGASVAQEPEPKEADAEIAKG